MIELQLPTSGVVTSSINGFRMGMVPTTATNINYDTVVPQPFTHHLRDGVRPAIENRMITLESKVDRMDNDISEISEFTDEVNSDIFDLTLKLQGLEERLLRLESLQREESPYGDMATHHRRISALEEAMRIFPCRT